MNGKSLMIVELALDATNDDLLDKMRAMKRVRERNEYKHVVCCISGYGKDARELWDIPAVRAFCRRLVSQGFISYLDVSTQMPGSDRTLAGAFAALEVWLTSEGLMGQGFVDEPQWNSFRAALNESNAVADTKCGAFGSGT